MTLKYGLIDAWRQDSFRKLSKKEFTFDNGWAGASLAMSRIDKFMVSQIMAERGGRIEAAASVREFINHSPLIITV
jgi:exonuclease III